VGDPVPTKAKKLGLAGFVRRVIYVGRVKHPDALIHRIFKKLKAEKIKIGLRRFLRYLANTPKDRKDWSLSEIRFANALRRTVFLYLRVYPLLGDFRLKKRLRWLLSINQVSLVIHYFIRSLHVAPCKIHNRIARNFKFLRYKYLNHLFKARPPRGLTLDDLQGSDELSSLGDIGTPISSVSTGSSIDLYAARDRLIAEGKIPSFSF
jgi:hypothetical protein